MSGISAGLTAAKNPAGGRLTNLLQADILAFNTTESVRVWS